MKGDIPVEVASVAGAPGKILQKGTAGECLPIIGGGITDVPMMFQGKVNPRPGGVLPDGAMSEPDGFQVRVGELLQGDVPHIAPPPMGIDLIAEDIPDD